MEELRAILIAHAKRYPLMQPIIETAIQKALQSLAKHPIFSKNGIKKQIP